MRSSIILIIISSLLLTSCGTDSDTGTLVSAEKQPFVIQVQKLSDFSGSTLTEKSGRIVASSSLTLSSKSAGEISKILVREGQYIKPGATVALIRDTVNNYDLRLEQAENNLLQQNASIATTDANMNTSIDAARIALARARLAYENSISRKNIQLLTLSTTNLRTIDSYNVLYKNYLSDLERQMTQMLYAGDKILGITTNFEYSNDPWEPYLGTRIGDARSLAVSGWNKLYAARGELRARINKAIYLTAGSAQADLKYVTDMYDETTSFADDMLFMIQNNVIGGGLPQALQDGWVAEWNGFRAQVQASLSGYGAWQAQVLWFLKTYESTEKATDFAIASLTRELTVSEKSLLEGSNDIRVTYENARIALRESIENARLSLEQAESSYTNAMTVKSATLTQMSSLRANAEIALAQARREYAKLAITAPVEWTITKMRIAVGETVNPGSPIAEFAGKKPEIVLDLDPELTKSLGTGDSVEVDVDGVTLSGEITALSTLAGNNLLSTVRIAVPSGERYIGQSAIVKFTYIGTIKSQTTLVPIDAIRVLSEGEGEVAFLTQDMRILKKAVKIQNIGGTNVAISGDIQPWDVLVMSDLSNFDPQKHFLQIQ